MEDYPRTLAELESRFGTEDACRTYLFQLRWPEGFACAKCGARSCWHASRGRVVCSGCQRQTSITAGTVFQDRRKPLVMWFRAIWWMTSQKTGASALGLQRILGLGSYKTAWAWLHKLRRAMVRPGRERLSGRIEVDESYLGGVGGGVPGRGAQKKALIAVAAEEDGRGIGRIRMRRISSASAKELQAFVKDVIEPGSIVHTDGWDGYAGIGKNGYSHESTPLGERKGSEVLPRVHKAVSLLKRWLMGTHQGAVSHEHLDYYLDEFTFRFNRRTSRYRGKLFFRLLQNAVAIAPAPYKTLVKHARGPRPKQHNQ